jgi:hypothetical protein
MWLQPYTEFSSTVDANVARKDVLINGYAMQTTNPIVDLEVSLPFNNICGGQSPPAFQEMRFSNNGINWSAWEAAPSSPPFTSTKPGWDLANPTYGGTAAGGIKYVFIQFRNVNCASIATHDEILYEGGSVVGVDVGLRLYDGTAIVRIACEPPGTGGELTSPLRIAKGGTIYGIVLTDPNSPNASKFRIQTPSGVKAWKTLP